MAWFKVDDKFHSSVEVMSIPVADRAAAIGLWTLAGAWSADQLKNGYVPVTHLEAWGGSADLAMVLVRAKLWIRVGSRGFQFRNWSKWQVTREDVDERQTAWRDRKAAERARKSEKAAVSPAGVTGDMAVSHAPVLSIPSHPVPTQPNPTDETTDITNDGLLSNEIPVRDELEVQELISEYQALGIKNLPRVANALARIHVVVDAAECVDVARGLLALSDDHVRYPEKYIEVACQDTPDDVRILAGEVLSRSPLSVSGGVA